MSKPSINGGSRRRGNTAKSAPKRRALANLIDASADDAEDDPRSTLRSTVKRPLRILAKKAATSPTAAPRHGDAGPTEAEARPKPLRSAAKTVSNDARFDRATAAFVLTPIFVAVLALFAEPEGWSPRLKEASGVRIESATAVAALAPAATTSTAQVTPSAADLDSSARPLGPHSINDVPIETLTALESPQDEIRAIEPTSDLVPAITRESAELAGRERACELEEQPTDAAPLSVRAKTGASPTDLGRALAEAAAAQTREFVVYTDRYKRLAFPHGDVSPMFGVCTDVIIRAYRAVGVDLQALVYRSRMGRGDPSIDHRRTHVLRRFFAANGQSFPPSDVADDYLPGDIVSYHRPQNSGSQSHIAIVSNVVGVSGRPLIVHNRGWGPQIEDALFVDRITGHYRYLDADLNKTASRPGEPSEPAIQPDKPDAAPQTARKRPILRPAKARRVQASSR